MADIEIQNVTKKYGKTVAVNDVSLKVSSGSFTVILGPSGSGKTTLLRCVAGFEEPDSGAIVINGAPVTQLPPRERDLAMVFQNYALFPLMTVRENIGFPLKVRNASQTEIDARVKEVADFLFIKELLDKRPAQLSGGEQQRAALGRAIVRQPNALLMDEPLTSLDAPLRAQMRTELKRIRKETKMTAIYVTHDQAEAMSLADMLAIMSGGRLMQYDKPLELYAKPGNSFVAGFVGNPPTNMIPAVLVTKYGRESLQMAESTIPLDPSMGALLRDKVGDQGQLLVGIRPEDVQAYPSRNSERSFEIVVDSTEPLGSSLVINALVEGNSFKLVLPPDRLVKPGDHLWLDWQPSKMHVFESKSGSLVF
jgi:multiple sugar transport system ATP-binding protein